MKKHPHKGIQASIDHAVANGWIIIECSGSAHPFCKIRCGIPGHSEHMHSIWSTPKNPEGFAKQIKRAVDKCQPNTQQNGEEDEQK